MSDLLDTISSEIGTRRRELEPLVAEYVRLVAADQALIAEFGPLRRARQARRAHVQAPPSRVRLHVQTLGAPTEREMRDRDVAHVTQEPA